MAKKQTIEVFIKVDSEGDHCIGLSREDVHAEYEESFGKDYDDEGPPTFKIYKVVAEVELPEEEIEMAAMPLPLSEAGA